MDFCILNLHIWADEDNEIFDLIGITKLSLLKYLKIECNITVKLPDRIGMLRYLETLEVDARLFAVPSDMDNLERLLHLRLPSESILPQEVARVRSVRSLGYLDLSLLTTEFVRSCTADQSPGSSPHLLYCSASSPSERVYSASRSSPHVISSHVIFWYHPFHNMEL